MFEHINLVVGVMVVYVETGWSILFEMWVIHVKSYDDMIRFASAWQYNVCSMTFRFIVIRKLITMLESGLVSLVTLYAFIMPCFDITSCLTITLMVQASVYCFLVVCSSWLHNEDSSFHNYWADNMILQCLPKVRMPNVTSNVMVSFPGNVAV